VIWPKSRLPPYWPLVVKAYAEHWTHSVPRERLDHVLIQVRAIDGVC